MFLTIFPIYSISYATVINGSSNLSNTKFSNLTVNGSLKFNNLDIENSLNVNGSVDGKNLICKTYKVNGSSNVENIKTHNIKNSVSFKGNDIYVKNNIFVNGNINAKNITILGTTKIAGNVKIKNGNLNNIEIKNFEATFINSKVNKIIMHSYNSNHKHWPHVITLKSNSTVSGDIIFESKNGEVYLLDNSKVEGEIIGGRIVN